MATVRPPSVSALNVARCRAIAAHEPREDVRGPDHLAEVFLDEAGRQSLTNPAIHPAILQKLDAASPGGYEYFIARTAYLDAVVQDALCDAIPQLVFLGAGYDTRAIRFADLLGSTRVFELDEAATQAHKRAMLDAANVASPPQLTYVTIDFTSDSLADKLAEAGYREDLQTLFILEGVTYYLPPRTVDETFDFVRRHSARGSRIAFDRKGGPRKTLRQRFAIGDRKQRVEGADGNAVRGRFEHFACSKGATDVEEHRTGAHISAALGADGCNRAVRHRDDHHSCC